MTNYLSLIDVYAKSQQVVIDLVIDSQQSMSDDVEIDNFIDDTAIFR